jgi:hypothetical protein
MEIFISWSGKRSGAMAEALRDWLPMIINAARPFLSSSDIDKGSRWSTEIAGRLAKAKAGIICLTPSNLKSEWLLFEAGALSKTLVDTHVCTLLIGMKPTDVKGPLSQFQATSTSQGDILQLVRTLNSKLAESAVSENQLEKAFELLWSALDKRIKSLPMDEGAPSPKRSPDDMLDEILEIVRKLNRPDATYISSKEILDMMRSPAGGLTRGKQRYITERIIKAMGDDFGSIEFAEADESSSLIKIESREMGTTVKQVPNKASGNDIVQSLLSGYPKEGDEYVRG